jgi:2-oxoisovalerate dehydrogenase E2 component (dihydrolipoyl transacylase)
MAVHVIKMPDIGEGIAEVEIVEWHVKPGDRVTEDQVLADVMTDKATVQIPSPVVGTVVSLGGEVGQSLAVGTELIRLEVAGAAAQAAAAPEATAAAPAPTAAEAPAPAQPVGTAPAPAAPAPAAAAPAPPPRAAPPAPAPAPSAPPVAAPSPALSGAAKTPALRRAKAPQATDRPIASPSVRRRAWELGIDLKNVAPTGTAGRITHDDLDKHLASLPAQPAAAAVVARAYAERHDEQAIQVIGLRRRIAVKMQESKRRIPHFAYVEEVDVTEVEALRARLNAKWEGRRPRLTLLPLLARAIVLAVRDVPVVNARFDDDVGVITRYDAVHLGVATQTTNGLLVPVLRHAEARDLWSTASEVARLAEAARAGRATRDELTGSTITISSLGALGGIVTTPVINRPEVAIIGVNRIVERPVMLGGSVVARQMMNLSSSFDHRVVDGADAAQFVQAVRGYLEAPATMFVE